MEVVSPANPEADGRDDRGSLGEVFRAFLKLGVTSFGGPWSSAATVFLSRAFNPILFNLAATNNLQKLG
jgi:hypothetical protein